MEVKPEETKQVKGKRLVLGMLLMLLATILSIRYFSIYSMSMNKQVFGVFFCVICFVSGLILSFSSIQRKSRWNLVVTPVVVILGVIFVMNYLYYSGVVQIIDEYPMLRAEYNKNKVTVETLNSKIANLESQNRNLTVVTRLKNAELLISKEGKYHEAAEELRKVKDVLAGSNFSGMATIDQLISDLDRIPSDLHTRMVWLTIDIEKLLSEK